MELTFTVISVIWYKTDPCLIDGDEIASQGYFVQSIFCLQSLYSIQRNIIFTVEISFIFQLVFCVHIFFCLCADEVCFKISVPSNRCTDDRSYQTYENIVTNKTFLLVDPTVYDNHYEMKLFFVQELLKKYVVLLNI